MKATTILKIPVLLLAAVLTALLGGCPTETDDGGGAASYNDTPVTSFTGTRWTDDLIPESTITFNSATGVTLEGSYWNKKLEVNGAQQQINLSGTKTYETANDLSAAAVEPAVYILMNAGKRTGIELYYYKADSGTGKHQRLVVYATGILQPREFYLH
jgi:hypothetical protein